jgi:transcriptional adapter 2-alpha
MRRLTRPLSRAAEEELLLLDGLQMYGLGNFRDASTHVHTKTEQQCLTHYTSVYLNAAKDGGDAAAAAAAACKASSAAPSGPPSSAHVPKSEINGYFPLRGDFDVEHDNDAEKILADSA